MRFTRGFTLIELMVTIAVLAIVISIAVPSFSGMLRENRSLALTSELQGAIQLARSEAVKRRGNVVLCRRDTAGNVCKNGTDWARGWLIRIEYIDSANVVKNEVLKSWDSAGSLVVNGPEDGLTFKSNGTVVKTATFTVNAPGCTGAQKRALNVSPIGTTTLKKVDC